MHGQGMLDIKPPAALLLAQTTCPEAQTPVRRSPRLNPRPCSTPVLLTRRLLYERERCRAAEFAERRVGVCNIGTPTYNAASERQHPSRLGIAISDPWAPLCDSDMSSQ
jgi:hypothetical protein